MSGPALEDKPPPPPPPSASTTVVDKDNPGGGILVDYQSIGRPVGDTSSGAVFVSDLPKNFQGGEEALHFALGELFGQYGKIKKIDLYMDKGILDTENFKGEALVVFQPSKKIGTHCAGDPVYDCCSELDGRFRLLGFRMWRIKCEPASWQKEGYDVTQQRKKWPCVHIENLWEYDSSKTLSWFNQVQEAIRAHASENGVREPFVKVDPMAGAATVWCKGAQDAMKFAGVMHKSYFLGRKIVSTLCRKERPVQENLPKVPKNEELSMKKRIRTDNAGLGELSMKTPAQREKERKEREAAEAEAAADAEEVEVKELTPEEEALLQQQLTFILREGCKVALRGLVAKPENNGQIAEVVEYKADIGKYQLRMQSTGKTVKVKPENLELVAEPASSGGAGGGAGHLAPESDDEDGMEIDENADNSAALVAASKAADMAAGNVRCAPALLHDPRVDGFIPTVCVDPSLLKPKEEPVEVKRRESSRSRERRLQDRADAIKERLAADKGPRPGWVVPSPQEMAAQAAAAAGAAGGAGAAPTVRKEPEQSREELMKLSVGKLKELMREFGKSARGCIEKKDFVDRLKPPPKAG